MSESLEDFLAVFRSLESGEDGLVIIDDDDACRVLVAWSRTDQRWARPKTMPAALSPARHGKMQALWRWIVSGWDIDADEVSRLAGVPASVAHAKLEMLVGNRLIYPDGSMSSQARKVLGVFTARKLGFKQSAGNQQGARRGKGEEDETSN